MKLEDAEAIAGNVVEDLKGHCLKIEIVGSIRRKKPEVKDIDLVVIPAIGPGILDAVKRLPIQGMAVKGEKIVRVTLDSGINLDIYIADALTFETLKLIRTGSVEHNIRLCSIARQKGWLLKANGEGLLDGRGNVLDRTEDGILKMLLGHVPKPEER